MNRILLPNRDGDKNYLVQLDDTHFQLELEHDYPCNVTYCDVKQNDLPFEERDILFVDPSGGNPIGVGELVGGRWVITKVKHIQGQGFVFTVKEHY